MKNYIPPSPQRGGAPASPPVPSKRPRKTADPAPDASDDVRALHIAFLNATGRKLERNPLDRDTARRLCNLIEWAGSREAAIAGARAVGADDFHRGKNEQKTRYDSLADKPFRTAVEFRKWVEKGERASVDVDPEAESQRRYYAVADTLRLPEFKAVPPQDRDVVEKIIRQHPGAGLPELQIAARAWATAYLEAERKRWEGAAS